MKHIALYAGLLSFCMLLTACAGVQPGAAEQHGAGAGYALAKAIYPEPARKVSSEDSRYVKSNGVWDMEAYQKDQAEWTKAWNRMRDASEGLTEDLEEFCGRIVRENIRQQEGSNMVCSPANLYLALAMLTEITEGNTRAELLDILGADSIDQVRDIASRLWNSNYIDNGETVSLLADSIWLNEKLMVPQDTLKILTETYYADIYGGDPEDPSYADSLEDWLNEKTGGQLSDAIKDIEMDPRMLISLASTIYFRGKWQYPFDAGKNIAGTFHGRHGDQDGEYMTMRTLGTYFYYEHFGAVRLDFSGGAGMWVILPDAGYTPEQIAAEEDYLMFLKTPGEIYGAQDHTAYCELDIRLPKFDISSDLDECDVLSALGAVDLFDFRKANFTPLFTEDTKPEEQEAYLNQVKHAARVTVDEEGCTATAFTLESLAGAAMPQGIVEFYVDRPFLFVITGSTDAVLFAGCVNDLT